MTIPDPRPPDAAEIRADLDRLGVATTPAQDHAIEVACGCGCADGLRSLLTAVALVAAPRCAPSEEPGVRAFYDARLRAQLGGAR